MSSPRRLRELDRRCQLLDEQLAVSARVLELRGHGRHERGARVGKVDPLDRRAQLVGRPLDERRVKRAGDPQPNRTARARLLRLDTALADGVVLARDDDLARAVVVRGPDVRDLAAEALDHLVREPEDRGHRARPRLRGLGHRDARARGTSRIASAALSDSRRSERGELADGVPDHVVGRDPVRADRCVDRKARRDERRLLQLRVEHVLDWSVEADLLEVQPGGLAAGLVDGHRLGHCLGDVASHPGLVRALAREHEGDLAHAATLPFVHSISAEPQVRPAPIPVIRTNSPSCSRPSAAASASASGIEPDDVLP